MTDYKEMLELAAKAMGYKYMSGALWDGRDVVEYEWHPQDDEGQALRMAVKIRMVIDPYAGLVGIPGLKLIPVMNEGDPCAATCRAIVRAAAEIGKAMP